MKQHLPIKMGGVIAALILLSIAVGAILSGSPGISAQAVTTTPTPIDAIPRPVDAIPRPIQTTATPTPSLIPTSNSTISTPVPRSVRTTFTASANEGNVSITLNDVTNIEWVQVWVGTPDLNTTLHLEWYELATSATCTGMTCTVQTTLTVNPGNYVSYIQPWSESAGFIQNELEGWLGPVSFERTQFTSIPLAHTRNL